MRSLPFKLIRLMYRLPGTGKGPQGLRHEIFGTSLVCYPCDERCKS